MNSTIFDYLPITHGRYDWLQQRQEGIGSSDASAIVGLSSFESPYSLWEIKTGRAPLDPPVSESTQKLRDWGNRLEPIILEATAEEIGMAISKPGRGVYNIGTPWLHANLDGWTEDGRIFEAKTVHGAQHKKWDGQIADHAEIQVHHTGMVTGVKQAVVAALIGGNDLRVYEIELNPRIQEMLFEAEAAFWKCVVTDTPPDVDGHTRTLEALTSEWAHHSTAREADPDVVRPVWEAWQEAEEQKKAAAAAANKAKAELARLMDGHDSLTTGEHVWAKAQRGRLDMARLKKEHPDAIATYTRPTTAFDTTAFKNDHPDLYAEFQHTTIRPTKET